MHRDGVAVWRRTSDLGGAVVYRIAAAVVALASKASSGSGSRVVLGIDQRLVFASASVINPLTAVPVLYLRCGQCHTSAVAFGVDCCCFLAKLGVLPQIPRHG